MSTQQPDSIYIELGGGSASKSLAHVRALRLALTTGTGKLRSATKYEDAHLVERVLRREWQQTRSPFYAYVSQREYRALSRALRADAYSLAGEERELALLGVGNVAYRQFYAAMARSRKVLQRRARARRLGGGVGLVEPR